MDGTDGKIVIGTKIDDKGFLNDIKKLEREANSAQSELTKLEKQKEKLLSQKANLEQTDLKQYFSLMKDLENTTIFEDLYKKTGDIKGLERAQNANKYLANSYEAEYGGQALEKYRQIEKQIQENTKEQEKLKQKIIETNQELTKAKSANNIKNTIQDVGKELQNNIKHVSRWALALIGVRSAYMFVSQAMSTLSQYDEQMGVNIQYIRYLLASTLKPVIEYIIQLVYKLLAYINYIAQAWFHVNLFANASTEAFQKQNKALGGSVKKAKELQKTLAGFDEMNILQDSGDVGSGGGGGGVTLPSFPDMGEIERPWWLDWLIEHKDEVLAALAGITAGLIAFKALGLDPIMALGIGLSVAGLVYAIEGLLKYLKDPTWGNFGQIIQGIGIAVAGLGILFLGLPGIIAGVIILIVGTIIKYWDEIKVFLSNGIKWLEDNIEWVRKKFGDQIANIYQTFITAFKGVIIGFDVTFNEMKKILDGIIQFVKGVFAGNWKQAWEGINKIFSGVFGSIKGIAISVLSLVSGLVVSIAQTVGYTIADAFKWVVNGVLGAIESILNAPIKTVNKLINIVRAIPGLGDLKSLPTFKLPRLAKGGIINMPGKGIMLNGAIGGERGAEGVIPLTDSQQMALLGEAIGKYININATVPVYVGNRQIAREIRKIEAENDFAYNR